MRMGRTLYLLNVLLFVALSACSRPMPEHWTGTLSLPEGTQIPFEMNLSLAGPKPSGHFVVGNEKTPIPEISWDGKALDFQFSEYGADMHVTWDGSQLSGEYRRIRSSGTKVFPVRATPKSETAVASPNAPAAGTYLVRFDDDKEGESRTVAKLWSEAGTPYGTFIAPDGDYGLLKGAPNDNGIQLSRFTGWQAFAIEIHKNGTGTFHAASLDMPKPFKLARYVDAPSLRETTMKNPASSFAFACSSLSGETVRNTDERFKGKGLIVDIMGTWCHNCMDESPVLQKIYTASGRDKLEMVGLSFEVKEDEALGRKNLSQYRDRFGLTYPLLYCGSVDDSNVDQKLKSQLENFFAYPTTLFIDKTGKVRTIHAGFHGPGTGDQYEPQVQRLQSLAAEIAR
jgi:thiol-disulfide isomerase/thioredoxin